MRPSEAISQIGVPPNDEAAECATLAAVLRGFDTAATVYDDVAAIVAAEDFYRPDNRAIFGAMGRLRAKNEPIDLATVHVEMATTGAVDKTESFRRLAVLRAVSDGFGWPGNAALMADKVRRCAMAYAAINIATAHICEAYSSPEDTEEFLGRFVAALSAIGASRASSIITMADVMADVREDIRKTQEHGRSASSVTTGIERLDAEMGGLYGGELIIVAARPGTGKTVAMITMAQGAARDAVGWSLVSSLEMKTQALGYRCVASGAGIDGRQLRGGQLSPWQERAAGQIMDDLSHEKVAFALGARTVSQVRAAARRQKSTVGLCAVFVDYLGRMTPERRAERKDLEIGEMTSALKSMAVDLDVPVVVLVQLNREVEKRDGGRPRMSDLRDSGRIEEDADTILGLYRDRSTPELSRVLEIEILKGRNMGEGKVRVAFDPVHTKITNDNPDLNLPAPGDADYRGNDWQTRRAGEQ